MSCANSTRLLPKDCPRFNICNAAVCPLDPHWPRTVHLEDEIVCPYLLASRKKGAADYFKDDPVFPVVLGRAPAVVVRFPAIERAIERASRSGIRGANRRGLVPGQ